jgi:hypothetical protein
MSMRISIPFSPKSRGGRLLIPLALAAAFSGLQMHAAQANTQSTPAHRALHAHARPGTVHPLAPPAPAAPAPAPEPPHWPANDSPTQAAVVWDSQGLRIEAENSSLQQILKDFSTATGAQVDGMAADERVFGSYGPGQARDVLSQLLQGSGYNVIMIGDQGQGAPRSAAGAQPASAANPASSNDDDAEAEEPPQPPQGVPAPPFRPGFPPGGLQRTPQQINMQEQQMRMQQMQQQQQQMQQQGQPPSNPPN